MTNLLTNPPTPSNIKIKVMNKVEWFKISEDDDSTLPPVGLRVLIISAEGTMSIERRRHNQGFIYSDSTDSGCAIYWAFQPDFPEGFSI